MTSPATYLNRIVPSTPTAACTQLDIQFLLNKFPQFSESVLNDAIDFCGGVAQADSFLENQQTMDPQNVHYLRRSEGTEDLALLASSIPGVHPELGSSPSDYSLSQHYPTLYPHSPLSPRNTPSTSPTPQNPSHCSALTLSLMLHNQSSQPEQQHPPSTLAEALPTRDSSASPPLSPKPVYIPTKSSVHSNQTMPPAKGSPRGSPPIAAPLTMAVPSSRRKTVSPSHSPSTSPPTSSPPSPPQTDPVPPSYFSSSPSATTNLNGLRTTFDTTHVVKIIDTVKVEDHIEYLVSLQVGTPTWTIQRRYNDFYTLHSKLKKCKDLENCMKRLHLPGKKIAGNNSPSVIKERKEQLEVYLRELLSDGTLLRLPEVRDFLQLAEHTGH
ncbi:hypothetical protein Pelo_14994 [Pelomyxa schiedti]|nr:hypothetical protein Pelo_14994 [Pelomyxa schiedti]